MSATEVVKRIKEANFDRFKHNCLTCKNFMRLEHQGTDVLAECYVPEIVNKIKIDEHDDCHYYSMDRYYHEYPEARV